MFWENWNIFKSLIVMIAIATPLIVLALWFGGIIGKKERPIALYTLIGIIIAGIIGAFVYLQFFT